MRPSDGKFNLWPFAVIGFFAVLVLVSITPVTRLNATPPADFLQLPVASGKANPELARQYWDTANRVLQRRYRRTDSLPAEPPAEFFPANADQNAVRSVNKAARRAYWRKLRGEWLNADNWHSSYTIDALWLWRDLQSVGNGIDSYFQSRG